MTVGLVERSAFRVIGRTNRSGDGDYDAGAVVHPWNCVVTPPAPGPCPTVQRELRSIGREQIANSLAAAAAALLPDRALTGYEGRGG